MTDDKKPASAGREEWLYGAEYWVPENHMFKSGSECLEAFPDAGPACGIVSTEALRKVEAAYAALVTLHNNNGQHLKDRIAELELQNRNLDAQIQRSFHSWNEKNDQLTAANKRIERLEKMQQDDESDKFKFMQERDAANKAVEDWKLINQDLAKLNRLVLAERDAALGEVEKLELRIAELKEAPDYGNP